MGHILYSLYGHEGASTTCNYSPGGDFCVTSGADAVVNIWKTNINDIETEALDVTSGFSKRGSVSAAVASSASAGGVRPASSRSYKAPAGGTSSRSKIATAPIQSSPPKNPYSGGHEEHVPGGGVTGSGEELALTLEKIVS